MRNLEDNLRAAVRDLADTAPAPHDLAAIARRKGRGLRRRRQAAIGTAALALTLVAAAPFVIFRQQPRDLPTSPATPTSAPTPTPSVIRVQEGDWSKRPYRLPGGVVVTALTRTDVGAQAPAGKTVRDGNVVLDRDTGRYWTIPQDYYQVWGAPAGSTAIVTEESGRLLAIDSKDAVPREVSNGHVLDPQWSPDGRYLLITGQDRYLIWDARTGETTSHDAEDAMSSCPDDCFFTWLPNGREIALARVDPTVAQSEDRPDTVKDVAVYSVATGKRLRTHPVPGVPAGPDAWSPDGTLVLVKDSAAPSESAALVVDVRTGRTVGRIDGKAHFLPDGRILSIWDDQADVYDTTGALLATQQLPADFAYRTLSIGPG